MTRDFLNDNFITLLADALSEEKLVVKKKTCVRCGNPSTRSKCDPCFRAYRVERNVVYRDRKKASVYA